MKIAEIDDFLPKEYNDQLYSHLDGTEFPWFYVDTLNREYKLGNYYFCHVVIKNGKVESDFLDLFYPLLEYHKLSLDLIYKIKCNLYPRTQFRVHHKSHTDYEDNSYPTRRTCLYYVNGNNGLTIFEKPKRRIKSIRNKAIIFNGAHPHHSTTCTDSNARITVNIDILK